VYRGGERKRSIGGGGNRAEYDWSEGERKKNPRLIITMITGWFGLVWFGLPYHKFD